MKVESYIDSRYKEMFKIYLDEDDSFSFIGVERFVGNIGDDPIQYSSLSEIPQPHRHHVEQRINAIQRKAKRP